ncbi:MAG TPA: hypothetical protein VNA14_06870 [Mycobacteriales bacterium]|nr:hypothetical protein [Mycobacteriales bacterium]
MTEEYDAAIGPEAARTYSGRKMTLGVIAMVAVTAYLLNVLGERTAPVTDRNPPVITSVTPSP